MRLKTENGLTGSFYACLKSGNGLTDSFHMRLKAGNWSTLLLKILQKIFK